MARVARDPAELATKQYVPGRSTPGKLAGIDIDNILDRIASGDYAAHIARELGVCKAALHYKLRDDPNYQSAREIGTEIRLDHWLAGIEEAADDGDLNLARAKEVALRRLEWRAEREFPHRWGAKQQMSVNLPPALDAALAGLAIDLLGKIAANSRVIEHEDPHNEE